MKIAIVSTHPIQYQVPWFRSLAAQPDLDLKVYYCLIPNETQQGVGFNVNFTWDIPLLEGYQWQAFGDQRHQSLNGFFSLRMTGIHSALKRDRPDVVIITGWNSAALLQALWASVRLGIPRIVRGESTSLKHRSFIISQAHRALLSFFDGFLAIGESNRRFYLSNGVHNSRIFMTRYFVDNERFARQKEELLLQRDNLRRRWSIPSDSTCFLFAGKLIPKKRIFDLLDAIDLIVNDAGTVDGHRVSSADVKDTSVVGQPLDRKTGIHLLLAGSGELMDEARLRVQTLRLPVTFTGFLNQTEISAAYTAADCLVLPSDYGETWGLVVNEAMASGLPAIVSDRAGCGPDLIKQGKTGWIFPYGDIRALSDALLKAAENQAALRNMGECARAQISEYSIAHATQGTIEAAKFVFSRGTRRNRPELVNDETSPAHSFSRPHGSGDM